MTSKIQIIQIMHSKRRYLDLLLIGGIQQPQLEHRGIRHRLPDILVADAGGAPPPTPGWGAAWWPPWPTTPACTPPRTSRTAAALRQAGQGGHPLLHRRPALFGVGGHHDVFAGVLLVVPQRGLLALLQFHQALGMAYPGAGPGTGPRLRLPRGTAGASPHPLPRLPPPGTVLHPT